jgi:cation transport regulator ChaC
MLYFGYGSNMDWDRFASRCPSAQFLFKAALPDHQLAFTRLSRKNQCGTADILPLPGSVVWGVVYHMEAEDRPGLDRPEGVLIGAYRPENITVLAEGDASRPVRVFTYVVNQKQLPRPLPSRAYMDLLIQGAMRWRLPEAYLQQLRRVQTAPAP